MVSPRSRRRREGGMSDYLAFAGDRTWKRCDTLEEANEWLSQVGGGRVFVDQQRLAAAEADANSVCKCGKCGRRYINNTTEARCPLCSLAAAEALIDECSDYMEHTASCDIHDFPVTRGCTCGLDKLIDSIANQAAKGVLDEHEDL